MPINTSIWKTYLPYFLPYVSFLGIKTAAESFPNGIFIGDIAAYSAAAVLIWIFRKEYQELKGNKISLSDIFPALLIGFAGIVIWILPYHFIIGFAKTDSIFGLFGGSRKGIDLSLLGPGVRVPFFLFRFVGAVLVVPIFEELFIRSFLWRYLINPDIKTVAVGEYTTFAFWGTAVLFALSHNEWIVAFVYAILLNSYLARKKDIRLCMIAHGFSNAILIVYVCMSGNWFLW
ncbi:MAG: CAAX prenyl protease-related protein [bacterium]